MPRVKQWTDEDRRRALEWVVRKAATGVVFRTSTGTVSTEIEALLELADPDEVAERLRESLTDEAWKRLLGALRQRKHQAQQSEAGADEAQSDEPQQAGECQQCRRYQAQILSLEADLASARSMPKADHLAEAIIQASLGRPSGLAEYLHSSIKGSHWQTLLAALGADHKASAPSNGAMSDAEYIDVLQGRIDQLEEALAYHGLLDEDGEPIEDEWVADEAEHQAAEPPSSSAPAAAPDEPPSALAIASEMKSAGASLRPIAARLNELGIPTSSGKGKWHADTVSKLLKSGVGASGLDGGENGQQAR